MAKIKIKKIVEGFGVKLVPAGGGSWKGLCPFHQEKLPSFYVTPQRGIWHCFGCAEGGDAYGFATRMLVKHDSRDFWSPAPANQYAEPPW